jgi:hypothetical protein
MFLFQLLKLVLVKCAGLSSPEASGIGGLFELVGKLQGTERLLELVGRLSGVD